MTLVPPGCGSQRESQLWDIERLWTDQFDWVVRETDHVLSPITSHPDASSRPHVPRQVVGRVSSCSMLGVVGSACLEVDFEGLVPGGGLVGARGVVFDAVVLGLLDQRQCVGDVVEEQAFVLQRREPAFRGPALAWCPHPCADVSQFRVRCDEQLEVQRPKRATIIGHNRDHG